MKRSIIVKIYSLLNILLVMIGFILIGLSIWIRGFSNSNNLYQAFFKVYVIIISIFGSILVMLPFLGSMGLTYNKNNILNGLWNAKRIFLTYILISCLLLACEIFIIYESFLAYKELNNVKKQTNNYSDDYFETISSSEVTFGIYEKILSNLFNNFFWGATQDCKSNRYSLFWSWISNYCKESISSTNCKICNDYSIQLCESDYDTCQLSSSSSACPYTNCRKNIITFIVTNIMPLSYWILGFTILQILLIIITIVILFFYLKSGTRNRNNNRNNSDLQNYNS